MTNPAHETVLYIDDDPDDQEFFVTALSASRPDVKCYVAKDSHSALEIIETIPAPKIIFIDLHLPRVNGIELLRKLKTIDGFALIPTYILSSTLFEPYAQMIKELGGSGFLKKPASLNDFKVMFDAVLN
ncbi:MAG TPA: response regulator [Chryseosolibacter sp.]